VLCSFRDTKVARINSVDQNPVEDCGDSIVEQTLAFYDHRELLRNEHFLKDREDRYRPRAG
jgi:hypothetical protein